MTQPKTDLDALRDRIQRLGFFGLLSSWNDIALEPWLAKLVALEERERKRRSLERRLRSARIGPAAAWPLPSRPPGTRRLDASNSVPRPFSTAS